MDALPPVSAAVVQEPLEKLEDVVTDLTSAISALPEKRTYTIAEVAMHNNADDMWIIVNGEIYDITSFQVEHPGGKKSELPYGQTCMHIAKLTEKSLVLQKVAGKDATKQFQKYHRDGILLRYKDRLVVGVLADGEKKRGLFGFLKAKS